MDHISREESLELFLGTLGYLDEKHLLNSDDIDYFVLTELDSDSISFLHSYTVNILINGNLIPESIAEKVDQLRNLVRYLIDHKKSINEVRTDPEWKTARQMAKEILDEIAVFQKKNAN